jgi:hypothetical protein
MACATEPADPESTTPPTESELASAREGAEEIMTTLAEVELADLSDIADRHRHMRCVTVDTDHQTFTTITYACTRPFVKQGTVHFERPAAGLLVTVVDLLVHRTTIDSAATLFIPPDRTQPRTFDGALVVVGPHRELNSAVSATWVPDGRCFLLDATGTITVNGHTRNWTITGKRVCRHHW